MKPSPFAPIAIPRYEAAAGDATAKSDLRNAMTAFGRYAVVNGTFPSTIAEFESSGYRLSSRMTFTKYELKVENGRETVHMHVQHADSDNAWHVNHPKEGTEIEIR